VGFEFKDQRLILDYSSLIPTTTSPSPPRPVPNALSIACDEPVRSPSPLLRDVGPNVIGAEPSQLPAGPAPPLSKRDLGILVLARRGIGEGNTQGGTQEVGGSASASQNVSHDVCDGSFLPSPRSFHPTAHPVPNTGVTKNTANASYRPSTTRINHRRCVSPVDDNTQLASTARRTFPQLFSPPLS